MTERGIDIDKEIDTYMEKERIKWEKVIEREKERKREREEKEEREKARHI